MIVEKDEIKIDSIANFNLNTSSGSKSELEEIDDDSFDIHVRAVFGGVPRVREQMKE